MDSQAPTVGRIVHYTLSEGDVTVIDQQYPMYVDGVRARRNPVNAGDVCAAVVVRVFGSNSTSNLRVMLDGDVDYWATSRAEGVAPGSWAWPPRV